MPEPTQPTTTENSPPATPTTYGYCSWHYGYASGIRLINVVEQGSGSGRTRSACGPCRDQHGLIPYADQP